MKDLHIKGAKDDKEKPRLNLVFTGFANALEKVGDVGTFGANKYTDDGWRYVDNAIDRYLSAMLRHYIAHIKGEHYDKESKHLHLSHMAWNALAVLEKYLEVVFPQCKCTTCECNK